jgi:hypothetical protein
VPFVAQLALPQKSLCRKEAQKAQIGSAAFFARFVPFVAKNVLQVNRDRL